MSKIIYEEKNAWIVAYIKEKIRHIMYVLVEINIFRIFVNYPDYEKRG